MQIGEQQHFIFRMDNSKYCKSVLFRHSATWSEDAETLVAVRSDWLRVKHVSLNVECYDVVELERVESSNFQMEGTATLSR